MKNILLQNQADKKKAWKTPEFYLLDSTDINTKQFGSKEHNYTGSRKFPVGPFNPVTTYGFKKNGGATSYASKHHPLNSYLS